MLKQHCGWTSISNISPDRITDEHYKTLIKLADPSKIEKKISMMQRRVVKGKEYLTYMEEWRAPGFPSVTIVRGRDYQTAFREVETEEGVRYLPGVNTEIYTLPFEGAEQIDSILEKYPETLLVEIQYSTIVGSGGRTDYWTSEQEFKELSFNELKDRGRLGVMGAFPTDISTLNLDPEKRLALNSAIRRNAWDG